MSTVVSEELIAAAPMSIAFGLTVVIAGTVRLATVVAELAALAAASRGFRVSTPE